MTRAASGARSAVGVGFLGIALGALIFGCASAPTKFYVLTPMAAPVASPLSDEEAEISLGVGPIELPRYLDRPQLVRRAVGNELDVNEFQQWAEPLQHGVSVTIAENLSRLIPTDRLTFFPWRKPEAIDYQVTVRVMRFESDAFGEVRLDARWSLLGAGGKDLLEQRRATFTRSAGSKADATAIAAAMSATLEDLSQEIATRIRSVRP